MATTQNYIVLDDLGAAPWGATTTSSGTGSFTWSAMAKAYEQLTGIKLDEKEEPAKKIKTLHEKFKDLESKW